MRQKNREIRPCVKAMPAIYGFSTLDVPKLLGCLKIGYTERTIEERKREIFHTAGIDGVTEMNKNAIYEVDPITGIADPFNKDYDFHAYLSANGIERIDGTEWFRIDPVSAGRMLEDFRSRKCVLPEGGAESYILRPEQERAVAMTAAAYRNGDPDFLWNAKPRFGKTLACYDLMKRAGMSRILVVTNRPAVADSWHNDYVKFVGGESGTAFVSSSDAVKGAKYVTRPGKSGLPDGMVAFTSLQDLKGADWAGGKYKKLEWIRDTAWDMMVVDESHEGASTDKADAAFAMINRKFTLWLSGTPFKQIASGAFPPERIFDWTYADEQRAKVDWSGDTRNPYEDMPRLNLYTYRLSDSVRDFLADGFDDDGREWAFDLGEFFKTDKDGNFIHGKAVDKFLDALSSNKKFPFSPDFRDPDDPDKELRHTFWLLNGVASVRALAAKLKAHPVFGKYEIVVAAGNSREYGAELSRNDIENVRNAIGPEPWRTRTIILSVGKLTTGVTIPELTGIMMLCNVDSPEVYMQTVFRAQNPCLFRDGSNFHRKTDAYVFDFDPARTLDMFGDFADGLCRGGAASDGAERRRRIGELLNFFPVIGEDPGGEMVELDAEKILTATKEVKAIRVVESGFMANCLFTNVGAALFAPEKIKGILDKIEEAKEQKKKKAPIDTSGIETDENGDVRPSAKAVIGTEQKLFGDKVWRTDPGAEAVVKAVLLKSAGSSPGTPVPPKTVASELYKAVGKDVMKDAVMAQVRQQYSQSLGKRAVDNIEKKAEARMMELLEPIADDFSERHAGLTSARASGSLSEQEYQAGLIEAADNASVNAKAVIEASVAGARHVVAAECEASWQKKEKQTAEEKIRDKLRGFSRTIPSFLMAYGTMNTRLADFDKGIPDAVFQEVTGITLDDFRLLRDGGDVVDDVTGETKHFDGGMFDEPVFDAACVLFMRKRVELADWFDGDGTEDIFAYIPPQRTNQIFTPRWLVVLMADRLEEESPGVYDDPCMTFIDPYMKSGMYITEIVRRLYRSEKLKAVFPDDKMRLKHIFENQVYGLAPTEIIYKIAMAYIFDFDPDGTEISRKNFRMLDAAEHAAAGTLPEKLDELFG